MQENVLVQAWAGCLSGSIGINLLALDLQSYTNIGDVPGNRREDVFQPTLNLVIPYYISTAIIGLLPLVRPGRTSLHGSQSPVLVTERLQTPGSQTRELGSTAHQHRRHGRGCRWSALAECHCMLRQQRSMALVLVLCVSILDQG